MAESAAVRRFLRERIGPVLTTAGWTWTPPGGSAGPRVYRAPAPAGTPAPYVVFDLLSPGNDIRVLNGNHVWTNMLWLVKAVAEGSSSTPLEAVVDAIHDALHASSGSVSGGLIVDCQRERPHDRIEITANKLFVNLGGEYRVRIQEAP